MYVTIARSSFLLLSLIKATQANNVTCVDTPDWFDSDAKGCDWYGFVPDNFENATYTVDDDNFSRCEMWGNCCSNFGETAKQACCVCGGGSYADTCENVRINGLPWTDATGSGCEWYELVDVGDDPTYYEESDTRCSYWGYSQMKNGYTAATACCQCGGGFQKGKCDNVEGFIDIAGNDCSWYEMDVQGVNIPLIDDEETRCTVFGHALPAIDPNLQGITANEACCVCGGGVQGLDVQPFAQTTRAPTRTPTIPLTALPSVFPTSPFPSESPSVTASEFPTNMPTVQESGMPTTYVPSNTPTESLQPTVTASAKPTPFGSSEFPSMYPSTELPSMFPTETLAPSRITPAPVTESPSLPPIFPATTPPPAAGDSSAAGISSYFATIIVAVLSCVVVFMS